MKRIVTLILIFIMVIPVWAQVQIPSDIKQLMQKVKTGQELTEEEEAKMEKWQEDFDKQLDKQNKKTTTTQKQQGVAMQTANSFCPKKVALTAFTDLTREKYIQLAQSLMATYGPKTGDMPQLKLLLSSADKPTDGADMGAAFVMAGAGSASVYSIAWSAAQKPDDVLTANNLGIALKDMGEYAKAIQVLKYANKLKPGIGMVLCNLGWAHREAGDYANAKIWFEKALSAAPEMTSPYLGLGLITKCEGNNLKAEEYLRKALAHQYSAVGFKAMREAKEAQKPAARNENGQPQKPLADEKGSTQGLDVPELPVFEQKTRMVNQKQMLEKYFMGLDSRSRQLISEMFSAMEVIRKQQTRALKDPDNALVFKRDFANEIMQFGDVTALLFGENGNYGQVFKSGSQLLENNSKNLQKQLPAHMQNLDETLRLQEQINKLLEQLIACGNNKICRKKIEDEIDKVKYQMEQVEYRSCKMQKGDMEMSFSSGYKNYKMVSNALQEAIPDYYAFTNPILEKIYSPSLNDYYNLYRELLVINHLKIASGLGNSLADLAAGYSKLKCVEPEPLQPPVEAKEPQLTKKGIKDCHLGEKGISGGIGVLSFELSCEHVKLSGGEGILCSVKRDFNKHETTIWGGVGVKGEYGRGNVTGEAAIGAEITIGQGDLIKNVAFTSSVKAGLGGLVEGEVSGRYALEGGPAIDTSANLIAPSLSDIMHP